MRSLSAVLLLVFAAPVLAAGAADLSPSAVLLEGKDVPLYVNYQGYLTDTLAAPITDDVSMVFTIYGDETGGVVLWTRAMSHVEVVRGVFNVKLPFGSGDTSLFMAGERRWVELTVDGHLLSPRTEITTMAYSFRSVYADNSDMLDGKHHDDFIWNTSTQQLGANFHIQGTGVAQRQLWARSVGLSNSAAVGGEGMDDNMGVYGESRNSVGVFGIGGETLGFGVRGHNLHPIGTGVAGSGCNDTLFFLKGGSGGAFSARGIGLFAYAHDTTGTAIATMGNRISDTVYTLPQGSGGAFNGTTIGVYGLARDSLADSLAGGFFSAEPEWETTFAYVAARFGGDKYKIIGTGNVSTIVPTREGRRVLFAPECPEPVFEDFGHARLSGGRCRVELDPLFLDCISVSRDEPLKVFVTLNDDCAGVYVKPDETGFDVRELNGGTSDAAFTWRVVGTRRGSDHLRLPVAPDLPKKRGIPAGSSAARAIAR